MSQQFKRLLFFNINKYQQSVLLPALIVCVISCVITIYAIYYVNYIDQNVAVMCHIDIQSMERALPWFMHLHSFNKVVPWLFFGLTLFLLGVMCWMFYVSNKLLGPAVRVLKELDEILTGKRSEPIGARPGDEVFEELVKRINILIQKFK